MATYSQDHGLYLPGVNTGHWTDQDLQANVDTAWQLPDSTAGYPVAAVSQIADVFRQTRQTVLWLDGRRKHFSELIEHQNAWVQRTSKLYCGTENGDRLSINDLQFACQGTARRYRRYERATDGV